MVSSRSGILAHYMAKHGTRWEWARGCRCDRCGTAQHRHERRRQRKQKTGTAGSETKTSAT